MSPRPARDPSSSSWTKKYLDESRKRLYHPDDPPNIIKFFGVRRGTHVLDVGCGLGFVARLFAPRVGPEGVVVGLDAKPSLLDAARRISRTRRDGIRFRQGDALDMPFRDHSFDVAICQTLFINVPNPERLLREMTRVVRPGGVVGCLEPVRQYDGLNSFNPRRPRRDALLGLRIWRAVRRSRLEGTGVDDLIAPSLPDLFFRGGLSRIRVRGFAVASLELELGADEMKRRLRETAKSVSKYRPQIRRAVRAGFSERVVVSFFERVAEDARRLLADDEFLRRPTAFHCGVMLAVRGTKPKG